MAPRVLRKLSISALVVIQIIRNVARVNARQVPPALERPALPFARRSTPGPSNIRWSVKQLERKG